jgi:glutathione S-transferase
MNQGISNFYVSALSPFGTRLRLVMAFTGQALAEIPPPDGSGSDAMKEISYFGKIPAIDIGGRVLVESIPLMEYLVEKARGSRLIPDTPEERAAMRGICLAHDNYVLAAIWPMFTQLRSGKPDPAIAVAAQKAAADQYGILTRMFDAAGDFVLGGRPTLADLAIAPFACLFSRTYPMFGQVSPFVQRPRLESWWRAVNALPEVATLIDRMDAAFTKAFAGEMRN